MAEEKLAQVDDKKLFQDIIDVCNSNIADAKAQEEGCSENEEN